MKRYRLIGFSIMALLFVLLSVAGCSNIPNASTSVSSNNGVLSSTGTDITGVLYNDDGDVIANAVVHLFASSEVQGSAIHVAATNQPIQTTNSDDNGVFVFRNVAVGTYSVSASDNIGNKAQVGNISVERGGGPKNLGTVFMRNTGSISGNVTLEGASSHFGTLVFVPGTSYYSITNGAGNYSIQNVPIGEYTLYFSHFGYSLTSTSNIVVTQQR